MTRKFFVHDHLLKFLLMPCIKHPCCHSFTNNVFIVMINQYGIVIYIMKWPVDGYDSFFMDLEHAFDSKTVVLHGKTIAYVSNDFIVINV